MESRLKLDWTYFEIDYTRKRICLSLIDQDS